MRNENYGKKPCAEKTLCSFQKQHYAVGSLLLHRPVPGVWRRGHNSPGPESLWAPNDYGWLQNVATMSQVLSSIQYICFRETLGSNMGAPNFLLAPGAIQHRYAHDLYVFSTNGPTSRSSFVILDAERDALKSQQLWKNNTLAKECGTRQKRNPTITRGLISN